MHSSYSLYACLFLFSFCRFFNAFEAGLPSSLLALKLRTAIDASSKWSHPGTPLTIFTPLQETCLVNRTLCSIKVTILNKVTVATMTGGPLGDKVYQFYAYSFSWKSCHCSGTYEFSSNVIYFNSEYGSYEKAFTKPDGIVITTYPITTSGNYTNPKFNAYGKFFSCMLKDGKSVGQINSGYTYTWFVNFPHGGIYHTCKQPYSDPDTGKQTTALLIILPSDPSVNFISSEQFQIFLEMGNSQGQFYDTDSCSSQLETSKGIVVYKLPA